MCVHIFLSNARVAGKQLLLNLKTSYVPQVSFAILVQHNCFCPQTGWFRCGWARPARCRGDAAPTRWPWELRVRRPPVCVASSLCSGVTASAGAEAWIYGLTFILVSRVVQSSGTKNTPRS